ncbi:hypothetical protein, unlikely [Trypanosoma brucei gambiense DAL972]|uniref:Uncharacterized protein n=1 Tax=Trypanosoma brucei gambiense (strain MHOM/CI/86/DAL972) TaxID=679716 RepID=C9ZPH9_TRYB9|nr:hypothetical protein, unlikely [Trypanosoma brucei gambiense DAL972]CBH11307.1 hypothetical protein, unlikely [Trypanosoma brucei gambiense DAL972]|eukprot:XP_011773594.1 hypothetical protein, unlikely [Trypanosoma brucei gambiense DAL972]
MMPTAATTSTAERSRRSEEKKKKERPGGFQFGHIYLINKKYIYIYIIEGGGRRRRIRPVPTINQVSETKKKNVAIPPPITRTYASHFPPVPIIKRSSSLFFSS